MVEWIYLFWDEVWELWKLRTRPVSHVDLTFSIDKWIFFMMPEPIKRWKQFDVWFEFSSSLLTPLWCRCGHAWKLAFVTFASGCTAGTRAAACIAARLTFQVSAPPGKGWGHYMNILQPSTHLTISEYQIRGICQHA
jgi:hypothetical protein